MSNTAIAIRQLLDKVAPLVGDTASPDPAIIASRLDEPLRVAIAGRVKAGKSTLLNALIGERLAPTDAGECTRVVTWYRHGSGYAVNATMDDGRCVPVRFQRERDRLVIDETGLDPSHTQRIDVTWPSARLQRFTLIDTPGLEAHDATAAEKARTVLGLEERQSSEVDAVVYLMRHMHRLDAQFLEAFMDQSLTHPSPVNAVAVLSRADELGAGRPDALDSAASVAARYSSDARIRNLCSRVVPVAGLIGEAGRTLQEGEGGSLRVLAEEPKPDLNAMVLSVDRFTDPERSPLDRGTRQDLLIRLGLFGVRLSIQVLEQPDSTTADVARALVARSGVNDLARFLDEHFGRRSELLKIRSSVASLKALVAQVENPDDARELGEEVERLEATAPEFAELRLLYLSVSGAAEFDELERAEVDRLVSGEPLAFRLGWSDDADTDSLQSHIIARLADWRARAAFPLASSQRREACELVCATYERIYTDLTGP